MNATDPTVQKTTGILTVPEAAEVLRARPIAVSRLVALGLLAYNRSADGVPLVIEGDLQRYLGAGSRNMAMPSYDGGWFRTDSLSDSAPLVKKLREFLAEVEVTDDHVREMYEKQGKTSYLTAGIRITPAMRDAYNAGAKTQADGKVRPSGTWMSVDPAKDPLATLSAGQRYFVAALREHAKRYIDRKPSETIGLSPIERLYASPDAFQAAVLNAVKQARSERIVQTEWRMLPEFPHKKFSVRKELRFADIPSDFENEIAFIGSKAF
ncbi:hypothetical protein [Rosistilla oblonga]|uniref:hypothetical protein n=1 Tax=Rosistilla oblonga TaxID=2527990 RepID=UPI003A96ACF6